MKIYEIFFGKVLEIIGERCNFAAEKVFQNGKLFCGKKGGKFPERMKPKMRDESVRR